MYHVSLYLLQCAGNKQVKRCPFPRQIAKALQLLQLWSVRDLNFVSPANEVRAQTTMAIMAVCRNADISKYIKYPKCFHQHQWFVVSHEIELNT